MISAKSSTHGAHRRIRAVGGLAQGGYQALHRLVRSCCSGTAGVWQRKHNKMIFGVSSGWVPPAMKLSIEIELQPEELPLATELLKVLKQLTQSVRTRNADRLFKASLTRAEDPAQLDSAAAEINSLIELSNGSDEIVSHFFTVFLEVAFHPDLLARRQQSVAHFFYQLLPRLTESVKIRLRYAKRIICKLDSRLASVW